MAVRLLNWLRLFEGGAPGTIPAGQVLVYAKTDGQLYSKDDVIGERLLTHTVEPYTFAMQGTLAVQTGKSRIYLEGPYTLESVRAAVSTPATGASIIVDVNKNDTTIYTTQANRPTIAAGTGYSSGAGIYPDVYNFVGGDYITVDVDQIGSTTAGADLTVTIRLRRTA